MMQYAKELAAEIKALEEDIQVKKQDLESLYRLCQHTWLPLQFAPDDTTEVARAMSPLSAKFIPNRWKAECSECGFVGFMKNYED